MASDQREKACERCQEAKPLDQFHRNRSSPDGRQRWCADCTRAHARGRKQKASERKKRIQALVSNRPGPGRPTPDGTSTRDELATIVLALHIEEGLGRQDIGRLLDMTPRAVTEYLARGRQIAFTGDAREMARFWIVLQLEELHELAVEKGDFKEARLALMDKAKMHGFVSTGGNTLNVGIGVQGGANILSEEDLDARARHHLYKLEKEGEHPGLKEALDAGLPTIDVIRMLRDLHKGEIEGEVVEDTIT